MTTLIKLRRDTAANWTISNPILAAGEPGLETDTLRIKYGDGSTAWTSLSYQAVGNATYATTAGAANSVDVANVDGIGNIATINLDGNVSNLLAGDGTFVTIPVIPSIGNIASINLDGNASTVLYGNGVFAAVTGGGNASLPLANGNSNFDIAAANGNASITVNANSTWTFTNIGTIELANGNGYIQSIPNSAGDGSGLSTLVLSPDDTTGDDRYLIVDPTGPNHIHIRSGGNINNSNADLYLGGEENFVRVSDSSNQVRIQNETTQFINSYSFTTSSGYSSAAWQDDGVGGYQVIVTDPTPDVFTAVWGLNQYSYIDVNDGVTNYTLTATGSSSTPGGGPITFAVNEAPPSSPTALSSIYIELNELRTNYAEVSGLDFTVNVYDDVRITGNDIVSLRNRSNVDPVTIVSDYNDMEHTWSFHSNAHLELPGDIFNQNQFTIGTANSYIDFGTAGGNTTLAVDGNVIVNAANSQFVFATTGSMYFPTLTTVRGDTSGGTLTGQTLRFADSTIEAVITTPDGDANNNSSQRLVINPGKGGDGTGGEGGDIYLWAGRGGDAGGSGGDIKIRGGYGPNTGAGGYIRMEGGDSFDTGSAGHIEIRGGSGGNTVGGYIQIEGGYGGGGAGGDISITGGVSGAGPSSSGNVIIATGGNSWQFTNDGTLSAPGNISVTGNISANNIGNISATNLDGNVSNVLAGDGTFVALPVVGNVGTTNFDGNASNVLLGNGVFSGVPLYPNAVVWSTAPISNVAIGNAGEAAYDAGGNLYICVSTNTWSKFSGTTSW